MEGQKISKISKITTNVDELFLRMQNSKKKCGDSLKAKCSRFTC